MTSPLLRPEVQKFIIEHENDDEKKLVLQKREILGVPSSALAEQIAARRKAKAKLPLYYNTPGILYPPALNLEQSSSQLTATLKTALIHQKNENKIVADLTGGFGVDSFFISRGCKKLFYVEPNKSLLEIARHNHEVIGSDNIEHVHASAEEFLHSLSGKIDFMFCDPSRRTKSNKKVFKLSDCEPNIVELLPTVFQKSKGVVIKTSPLLDIRNGITELTGVEKVWVVSVDNECKELLFCCMDGYQGEATITARNESDRDESAEEVFSFTFSEEMNSSPVFSKPLRYLYEPNASILKAGAFKLVGERFSLLKIHPNTHLYTSEDLVQDFPGRIFKIVQSVKPDAKALKEFFPESKANVITRNYPLTPEQLKKKTKLNDGGEDYLIGFSGQQEKYLVAAERIK